MKTITRRDQLPNLNKSVTIYLELQPYLLNVKIFKSVIVKLVIKIFNFSILSSNL